MASAPIRPSPPDGIASTSDMDEVHALQGGHRQSRHIRTHLASDIGGGMGTVASPEPHGAARSPSSPAPMPCAEPSLSRPEASLAGGASLRFTKHAVSPARVAGPSSMLTQRLHQLDLEKSPTQIAMERRIRARVSRRLSLETQSALMQGINLETFVHLPDRGDASVPSLRSASPDPQSSRHPRRQSSASNATISTASSSLGDQSGLWLNVGHSSLPASRPQGDCRGPNNGQATTTLSGTCLASDNPSSRHPQIHAVNGTNDAGGLTAVNSDRSSAADMDTVSTRSAAWSTTQDRRQRAKSWHSTSAPIVSHGQHQYLSPALLPFRPLSPPFPDEACHILDLDSVHIW
ncbi:hypothetical protein BC831DRAFT_449976 [Entophlyctis helioformis]|nr:hypothetical protein BC831DRAFT_449976 [Entophlyctis helioformis]